MDPLPLVALAVGWLVTGWLVLSMAVAIDARHRGQSALLWFLLVLLFNVVGLAAYLVVRPPRPFLSPAWDGVEELEWERAASISAPATEPREPTEASQGAFLATPQGSREEARPSYGANWVYLSSFLLLLGLVSAAFFLLVVQSQSRASPPIEMVEQGPTLIPMAAVLLPTQVPSVEAAEEANLPPEPISAPPLATATPRPTPKAEAPTPSTRPVSTITPAPAVYVVVAGETLTSIARRFGVSQDAIMRANGIENADLVKVGQRLIIPAP